MFSRVLKQLRHTEQQQHDAAEDLKGRQRGQRDVRYVPIADIIL